MMGAEESRPETGSSGSVGILQKPNNGSVFPNLRYEELGSDGRVRERPAEYKEAIHKSSLEQWSSEHAGKITPGSGS